jgi:S1-C subfamily serine protease
VYNAKNQGATEALTVSFDESAVLEVVEKASKSVVNINTVRLLHDFYYQVQPVQGMGSGVIFDPKGYVLTNNHVIEGATKIDVTLTSSEVLRGRRVGACVSDDVAIIKVDAKDLPAIEFGNSDELRVGQTVFAIGNPFGLQGAPTVTKGVISAVKRSIRSDRGLIENLVQTDASINPGNSGGPLVDVKGRVVAINTAIVPFAQGIGFAIPVNNAKRCATEIITHGKVMRPWLGVSGLTITGEVASYYNLPIDRGALVTEVWADSPAEEAEMQKGDIIIGFGDTAINSVDDLVKEVQKRKIGEKARVLLLRDGQKLIADLTLGTTP